MGSRTEPCSSDKEFINEQRFDVEQAWHILGILWTRYAKTDRSFILVSSQTTVIENKAKCGELYAILRHFDFKV